MVVVVAVVAVAAVAAVVAAVVAVQTINGARVSVKACTNRTVNSESSAGHQCHHLVENVTTPDPAAEGPWRPTLLNQPTARRGTRLGGAPTSSLGSPDPERINLFHRCGVGNTRTLLIIL